MDISTFRLALLSGSGPTRRRMFPNESGSDLIPIFKHIQRFFPGLLATALLLEGIAAPAQGSAASSPQERASGGPRFVVVVDAAHGGDDRGGQVGASVAEKTVTLALSVQLRSLLTARGFSVVTTREGNTSLDSNARAQIADHAGGGAGAAACLSFHASEAGSGIHLFVSTLAQTQPVRFLAWKTAQSAFVARSLKLAGTLNSALEHSSPGGDSGDGGNSGSIPVTLGRASLPGIDSMTCPAVAVEVAPIRGADRKVVTEVTDSRYQTQIVEALAAALLEWKTDWETEPHSGGRLP